MLAHGKPFLSDYTSEYHRNNGGENGSLLSAANVCGFISSNFIHLGKLTLDRGGTQKRQSFSPGHANGLPKIEKKKLRIEQENKKAE